jgi:hypothetical protein
MCNGLSVSGDVQDRMLAWLEESGRALETRVGRSLWRGGANSVVQSSIYRDPLTGQAREVDVLASFEWTGMRNVGCSITAVVECKSGRKQPWIAMQDARSMGRVTKLVNWVFAADFPNTGIEGQATEAWLGLDPFDDPSVASHVLTAFKDEVNPAGDAVRQVLSAAEALRTQHLVGPQSVGLVLIPVVVTAAPLYNCVLSDEGEMTLSEVDQFVVWGYSPIQHERRRVYVRSEAAAAAMAIALTQRVEEVDQAELR